MRFRIYYHSGRRTLGECVSRCKSISGESYDRTVEKLDPKLVKHDSSDVDSAGVMHNVSQVSSSTDVSHTCSVSLVACTLTKHNFWVRSTAREAA